MHELTALEEKKADDEDAKPRKRIRKKEKKVLHLSFVFVVVPCRVAALRRVHSSPMLLGLVCDGTGLAEEARLGTA